MLRSKKVLTKQSITIHLHQNTLTKYMKIISTPTMTMTLDEQNAEYGDLEGWIQTHTEM